MFIALCHNEYGLDICSVTKCCKYIRQSKDYTSCFAQDVEMTSVIFIGLRKMFLVKIVIHLNIWIIMRF